MARSNPSSRSGFSRRGLLLSSAALLGAPRVGFAAPVLGDRNLIVVLAEGGWDVTFCYDPKLSCTTPDGNGCFIEGPEVDETSEPTDREAVETFGNIPIVVNRFKRPAVANFFEKWHSRIHVINGIWTGSIAHDPCRYRILTGTPDGTRPDLATIHGYVHGESLPLGSVDLSGWSISGPLAATSGRVGQQSQIRALIDDTTQFGAPSVLPGTYPLWTADDADDAEIEAFVRARADQLRARFSDKGGRNDASIDDLLSSIERGRRFREQSGSILDSLTIGQRASLELQMQMGVEMLKNGICRSVTLDTRIEWDTHDLNNQQHNGYEATFQKLDLLAQGLEDAGLLDNTVVAVLSEMTRTPLLNAGKGKDHWGHTSAMLFGAVRGDAVSGATDHLLESLPVDLETGEAFGRDDGLGQLNKYDNLCAGILELVGVDPAEWLPNTQPFRGAHPS